MAGRQLTLVSIMLCSGLTCAATTHSPFSVLKQGHLVIQGGGYWGTQGKAQHIHIQDLVGDTFNVTNNQSSNGTFGLGYYLKGHDYSSFSMSYGLNAFYLPNTAVSGTVVQEDLFTNLSYRYNVSHVPVYAMAKAEVPITLSNSKFTVDAGIGPNFMTTRNFNEASLDSGITIPDYIFLGRSTTTFSVTAGIGAKINNLLANHPLECGYRFFYLGQGSLKTTSDQVINNLQTGHAYANAVLCSVSL